MFLLDGKVAFSGSNIALRDFRRRFVLDEKSVPLVVIKFFITISLPLERIAGSIFRKKWKIKTMFFSKSIIGFHYEDYAFPEIDDVSHAEARKRGLTW